PWSATLLVLHSFPTRRSSDLHFPDRRGAGAQRESSPLARTVAHQCLARKRGRRRYLGCASGGLATLVGEYGAAGVGRPAAGALGDRKSTRLNSSHVSISYAVF